MAGEALGSLQYYRDFLSLCLQVDLQKSVRSKQTISSGVKVYALKRMRFERSGSLRRARQRTPAV